MTDYLSNLAIGIILMLFFYFGYKDDYKRNPKEFIKTIIIVVPIVLLIIAINYYFLLIYSIKVKHEILLSQI